MLCSFGQNKGNQLILHQSIQRENYTFNVNPGTDIE